MGGFMHMWDSQRRFMGGYAVAMNLETTEDELMRTVFPHPTLSETMHEAVLGAFGRALSI